MEEGEQDNFSFHDPDDPLDMLLSSHRSPLQNNQIESEREYKQEQSQQKTQDGKNSLVEHLDKELDQMWKNIEQKDLALDKVLEQRQNNLQNISSRKGSGQAKQPQQQQQQNDNHNLIKKILNNDPVDHQSTKNQLQEQKSKDLEEPIEIEGTISMQQPLENSEDQTMKLLLKQKDDKINYLQNQLDQVKEELEQEQRKQRENYKQNDQNQEKLEKLQSTINQVSREKEIVNSQKQILDKEYATLQQDYQQLVSKFNQTKKEEQDKYLALLDSNRRLQIENNLLQGKFMQEEQDSNQFEKLQIELQKYMQATQNLDNENTQLRIQLEQTQNQQQKIIEQRLNSALSEINILNERLESQRGREKLLEEQKKKLEDKIQKADIEYAELKRIHEDVKEDNKKKREKLQQSQNHLNEKEKEIQRAQEKIQNLQQLSYSQQQLEGQLKTLGNQSQHQQQQQSYSPNYNSTSNNNNNENNRSSLFAGENSKKIEIEKYQQVEQELQNYKRLYEESKILYEKTSENLQQHLMNSQSIENTDQLKETIANLQFDVQKLKLDNSELSRELIQDNSKLHCLKSLQEQIYQKEQEVAHLDQMLQESRRDLLNFTEQNGYLKQRIDNLNSELGRQESGKTKRDDIINEQQHKIEDMTNQVAGLAQEVESLSRENKQLLEKICDLEKLVQQGQRESEERNIALQDIAAHFNRFMQDFLHSTKFNSYIQLASKNFRDMVEYVQQKIQTQTIAISAVEVEKTKRLYQFYSVLFTELEHQFKVNLKSRQAQIEKEEDFVKLQEKNQELKKIEEQFVCKEKQLLEQIKLLKSSQGESIIAEYSKDSQLIEEYKNIIKKLRQQNNELEKQVNRADFVNDKYSSFQYNQDNTQINENQQIQEQAQKYEQIKYNYGKIIDCLLKIIPNIEIINCTSEIMTKLGEIDILEQFKRQLLEKLEDLEADVKILVRNTSTCDQQVIQLRKIVEKKRTELNDCIENIQTLKSKIGQLYDNLRQNGQVEKHRLENILHIEKEYIKYKKQNEELQSKYDRMYPIAQKLQQFNQENQDNAQSVEQKLMTNLNNNQQLKQQSINMRETHQRQALCEKESSQQIQNKANIVAGTIAATHQRSQSFMKNQTVQPEKDVTQKRFSEKKSFLQKQGYEEVNVNNKLQFNNCIQQSNYPTSAAREIYQDDYTENSYTSKKSLRDKLELKKRQLNVTNNQNY